MEIRQLEYFLAVVDNGGVAPASAVLSVAPHLVSEAVHTLEMELDVRLFHRLDTGMRPSSAGWSLIGPARRVVRAARGLIAEVAAEPGEISGTLSLGVFPPLAGRSLTDLVRAVRAAHPQVRFRIQSLDGPPEDSITQLRSGRVDFLFTHLPVGDGGLAELPLGGHAMELAFPVDAGLPPGPIDLGDLPGIPMVLAPSSSYTFGVEIEARLSAGGHRPQIGVLMEPREGWLPLVEAGVCGAMFGRSQVEDLLVDGHLDVHPMTDPIERTFGLVYNPSRLDPAGRALIDIAAERVFGR